MKLQSRESPRLVPPYLQSVSTPLVLAKWASILEDHPDRKFRDYILYGIAQGFRIGFDYASCTCASSTSNMASATEQAPVVQAYLEKELALGRIVGPVGVRDVPVGCQVSPFGVIPKSSQPGKWRLIVDLSSPKGRSVNDGIEAELCSLTYLHMDKVSRELVRLGPASLMAKMDIESAYRIVPVDPADRLLLGVRWQGGIFFDTRLPFGLRSAPKIFSAVADALQWILERKGVQWVAHYLDDFILLGSPGSSACQRGMDLLLQVCKELGVPVSAAKCAGPTTRLVFLGFVDLESGLQEKRPGVSSRPPAARGNSCAARPYFRSSSHRTTVNSGRCQKVDTPECRYSVRPAVVVSLPGGVERGRNAAKGCRSWV